MEGLADNGALQTLVSITGASESVGTRLLQDNGGDLNAAVNAFFIESDAPVQPERENDFDRMEEDEPAIGIPAPPRGIPPLFGPGPLASSIFGDLDSWNSRIPGRRSQTFGTEGPGRAADVRTPPVVWPDDDDDIAEDSYPPVVRHSNPRIEEIPSNGDNQLSPPSHQQAMVDEDAPGTATSFFRSGVDATEGGGRSGARTYIDDDLIPGFNPNAPRIAEVPVMAPDEGVDIEEEMLRAAIEASKRDATEASRIDTPPDVAEETTQASNPAERFPSRRPSAPEDDDLARAVSLSLKTAEEEKALRERAGASSETVFMQEDQDNPLSEDVTKADMRKRGVARDRAGISRSANSSVGAQGSLRGKERRGSGSKSSTSNSGGPIVSGPPDEVEEVEEQPLLRRRTSRRSIPSTAESGIMGEESQARIQTGRGGTLRPREAPILPTDTSVVGSRDEVGGGANSLSQNDDNFPSEEWGGISSEEHDEAVMLEAALFGGLPERRGLGLPYQPRRGIHNDDMDALTSGEAGSLFDPFNRRGIPQPPSPSVVAQRLIREQQDDEFLASLAADREKELKAIEEAEIRRLQEQEAAEALASQERLRREEELKQQREAEDLERQLALKKESLPVEPAADEQGALFLAVRLPDGSRHGRRFHKSNKLQSLFDFIDVGGGVRPGTYRLVRQYPRVAFTDGQHASSLESLGLTSKQEVLLAELI